MCRITDLGTMPIIWTNLQPLNLEPEIFISHDTSQADRTYPDEVALYARAGQEHSTAVRTADVPLDR